MRSTIEGRRARRLHGSVPGSFNSPPPASAAAGPPAGPPRCSRTGSTAMRSRISRAKACSQQAARLVVVDAARRAGRTAPRGRAGRSSRRACTSRRRRRSRAAAWCRPRPRRDSSRLLLVCFASVFWASSWTRIRPVNDAVRPVVEDALVELVALAVRLPVVEPRVVVDVLRPARDVQAVERACATFSPSSDAVASLRTRRPPSVTVSQRNDESSSCRTCSAETWQRAARSRSGASRRSQRALRPTRTSVTALVKCAPSPRLALVLDQRHLRALLDHDEVRGGSDARPARGEQHAGGSAGHRRLARHVDVRAVRDERRVERDERVRRRSRPARRGPRAPRRAPGRAAPRRAAGPSRPGGSPSVAERSARKCPSTKTSAGGRRRRRSPMRSTSAGRHGVVVGEPSANARSAIGATFV